MTARLVWIAGRDGEAHASRPGHALALCGVRSHDPCWSWPTARRCAACQALEVWPPVRALDRSPSTRPPSGPRAGGSTLLREPAGHGSDGPGASTMKEE